MAQLNLQVASGPPSSALKKPKHVDAPNMQYIQISHPLPVIDARLQVSSAPDDGRPDI